MEDTSKNGSNSQMFNVEGGKTKSLAIDIPSISLPKGGGAIKGIDEKFSVNSVNGTASFSIPLPFAPARGASQSLSISYNSGAGNGIFGLGWNLSLPSIKRKTDKGLPQYLDIIDSDTFLFLEAEDLVPEFKTETDGSFSINADGEYIINEKDSTDGLFTIRYYKPRIEGLFARIERWYAKNGSEIKWRITTRDNTTTLFGWTANARITNPEDNSKIFEWLPEFVFDDKGNCAHYIYKPEDSSGFDDSVLHNRNRFKNGNITYTNTYLDKVLYGNKIPYKKFGDDYPPANDYMFSTLFDYGTLLPDDTFDTINNWDFRPDAFSDYKSGFEIRTTRLCKRVLLFHHFTGANEYDGLVRSVNFEYDTNVEEDFTFLKNFHSHGYIKKPEGNYSEKQLPPMEFTYQSHDWNKEVKTVGSEDLVHAPSGLYEQHYQFTDLYNEGLNGILTEQATGWYYKHNLGVDEFGQARFAQAKLVTPKPSFAGLGSVMQLADLDADGGKQLVSYSNEPLGYFELNDENEWQGFRSFNAMPNIDFGDRNTRMLDLNGDGKPEVVISEDNIFTWYPSEGRNGFSQAQKTIKPFDEEAGPAVIFADQKQTIFLADMSGSGMSDIVRIRNGEVCYWPNLGYGKFGAKVSMDNAPVFDLPDTFNASYLRLADIDGSGTTDIVYLGKNKFTCWKNLSGNRFGPYPFEIDPFAEINSLSKITVTDLLGNGVACIVWSSPLLKDANAPLKYIDLMNSKKPHIMVSYKNNMGKEVSLEYTPSTKFYLDDKKAGKPWVTKLHFPIHCISKTVTEEKISGYRFQSSYKYHHGYYDHFEREFRGFGMVEQIDAETFEHWVKVDATNITEEDLHQEPVVTKSWQHTGAFLQKDKILNQFAHEYWYEEMARQEFSVTNHEVTLPDAKIIDANGNILNNLSTQEWREALRACKGMGLRSEVFALDAVKFGNTSDAIQKELTPFSVATHNCMIEMLQPKGKNKHAVFVVKESEAISYNYERNTEDPRVAHTLNIKLDEFGNVLESASVVYPRLVADTSLPTETQQEQSKTVIMYSENHFTNDVISDETYRLRLPSEVKTFELKGVVKSNTYYSATDFTDILSDLKWDTAFYHELDKPLIDGRPQKRIIEHVRSIYYSDNLSDALPLHQLESLAMPYEAYQLAYTPELLDDIYNPKVSDLILQDLMIEGKFAHALDDTGAEDTDWWIRSGTTQFLNDSETVFDAASHFYLPVSYTDPYGAKTKVKYYGDYFLFIEETEDALGNKSEVDVFNFRTLSPQKMKDINGNFSEAISDELGLVKAVAIMGKGDQADELTGLTELTDAAETALIQNFFNAPDSDQLVAIGKNLLQHSSSRFVYDFEAYINRGEPAVVAAITRETHYHKPDGSLNPESRVQIAFEYSNGIGEVIMKKVQVEPGKAKQVVVNPDNTIIIKTIDTKPLLRWIGNGRTIKNNKGNPVKQYEPYFSTTWHYENYKELVETSVTPIMYYDAAGRLIKTEMPDGTFSKVEFDSWKQIIYDANDTVLESDWYLKRTDYTREDYIADIKDEEAAAKAAKHFNTPNTLHFDTLGRPVLSIEHNKTAEGADEFYHTRVMTDTEGNLRSVTDARGNIVVQYKYDMLGNKVYQNSMDAGQRWLLINILGNPLRTWDERNHEFQYYYDKAHRPTESKVIGGDGKTPLENIFGKVVYGETLLTGVRTDTDKLNEGDLQTRNVLGQVIQLYDTGGLIDTPEYDFKGKPLTVSRKLFSKYKEVANWTGEKLEADLETDSFVFSTETDALGRITKQTAPDKSVITPRYNEAGLLDGEFVNHFNARTHAYERDKEYIKDIDYNEKGQRNKIIYGNNVSSKFDYDDETFRLKRLNSKRLNGDQLQDLYYTYDPVGNITHIEDKTIPAQFFSNQIIKPISEYRYDALYQLVEATGRENNAALSFGKCDNWNDKPFMNEMKWGDPSAVRNYTQSYQYDSVGNIREMKHVADGGNWTRQYHYETLSNRLQSTNVGDIEHPANYTKYKHHAKHGYMEELPHLEKIGWNFKEEVVLTTRQHCADENIPVITYYQYDGSGQRIRKITENQAAAGTAPTKKDERIYIAGYETYRTYASNILNFERNTLSLMDGDHRFIMIETILRNELPTPSPLERIGVKLIRYQLHNHLGSAALELDATAQVISYEEYHPFGTTAYQNMNKDIKATAKRYCYTGMERDEETGLEYHSARYYLPWLGRWLSSDPIGIEGGANGYRYSLNNPTGLSDINGTDPRHVTGELGELLTDQFLDQQGYYVFKDWSKNVTQGGFDSIAYNPHTKELLWIDNKAYKGTISGATSLEKNFVKNKAAAIKFLETQTSAEAIAALEAVGKNEVRLISNGFSGSSSKAGASIFSKGMKFLDVYAKQFSSSYAAYAESRMSRQITEMAASRGLRLKRQGGFSNIGIMSFIAVATIGGIMLTSSDKLDTIKDLAIGAAVDITLTAALTKFAKVGGGVAFVIGGVLDVATDSPPTKEELITWDIQDLLRENFTDLKYDSYEYKAAFKQLRDLYDKPYEFEKIPKPPPPHEAFVPSSALGPGVGVGNMLVGT